MRLKDLTLAGLFALTSLAAPAHAQEGVDLKLSTFLPPPHQMNVELKRWADALREKSGGKLDIELFPAGQMGPVPRQLDLARTGVADMSFVFTAATPGRFPRTDILGLPFLLTNEAGKGLSSADASWLATEMRDSFADDTPGVKVLYYVVSTSLGFFMKSVTVKTPDDLDGLRIRSTTASVADMLEELGASPASVSTPEVADAIGKGVVDGAVFNFEGGKAFGLAQSVNEVTPLNFSASTFAVVINQDVYDSLPADLRQMIDETTRPEDARHVGGVWDEAEAAGEDYMKGQGVNVTELTTEQILAFRDGLKGSRQAQIDALQSKDIDADALITRIQDLKSEL